MFQNLTIKVFGFDSFTGLPEDWIDFEGKIVGGGGCKKGLFDNEGNVPNIPNITFYKGLFQDTLQEYLKIGETIALIHMDCDLYSSTKFVLNGLNDLIKENTFISFDEWIYQECVGKTGDENRLFGDHEQRAFYEWVEEFNREFEIIDLPNSQVELEQKLVRIKK
jgi:hypothetical protein